MNAQSLRINDKSLLSQITKEVADELDYLINLLNNFKFDAWGPDRSMNFSHYVALKIRSQLTVTKYLSQQTNSIEKWLTDALGIYNRNLERIAAMLEEFMWDKNGIESSIEFSQFIVRVIDRESFTLRNIAIQIERDGASSGKNN